MLMIAAVFVVSMGDLFHKDIPFDFIDKVMAAARYLKELKDSGEAITPKVWQREIDQLAAEKQTDTLAMKSMREDLKAVERLRKTAEQLSRQERDKSHDREPER